MRLNLVCILIVAVTHAANRDDLQSYLTELAQYSTMSLEYGSFDTTSYMSYLSALATTSFNYNGITLFFGRPDVSSAYAAVETISSDNTKAMVAWASSFYNKYLSDLNTLYDYTAFGDFMASTGDISTVLGNSNSTRSSNSSSRVSKTSSTGSGSGAITEDALNDSLDGRLTITWKHPYTSDLYDFLSMIAAMSSELADSERRLSSSMSLLSEFSKVSFNWYGWYLFGNRPDVSAAISRKETIRWDNTQALLAWSSSFLSKYLKQINTLYDSTAYEDFLTKAGYYSATESASLGDTGPTATTSGSGAVSTSSGSNGALSTTSADGTDSNRPLLALGAVLGSLPFLLL